MLIVWCAGVVCQPVSSLNHLNTAQVTREEVAIRSQYDSELDHRIVLLGFDWSGIIVSQHLNWEMAGMKNCIIRCWFLINCSINFLAWEHILIKYFIFSLISPALHHHLLAPHKIFNRSSQIWIRISKLFWPQVTSRSTVPTYVSVPLFKCFSPALWSD